MDLNGRRESSNVEDRRGKGGRVVKGTSLGIGGIIIIALISWLVTGNPLSLLSSAGSSSAVGTDNTEAYVPTAEEEEYFTLAKKILAATEDVWTAEFEKIGKTDRKSVV